VDKRELAEALRHMCETTGWQFVEQHIRERAADSRQRLMDCATWEKVHEHRGEVTALEGLLAFVQRGVEGGEDEDDT